VKRKQSTPVKERTELARRLRSQSTPARPHDHGPPRSHDLQPPKPEPEYGTRTTFAWVAPD
jgi:hypothetical protein